MSATNRAHALMGMLALAVVLAWLPVEAAAQTTTTAPAIATVQRVRIPFPQDDGTLTPYTFELGYPLVTLVYDTLLLRGTDGLPRPWLAKAVDASADGRELIVHLADGVKWHDGAPLTAADVVFTFEYAAAHRHPRFTPEVATVERVSSLDPATVRIRLRQPSPGFSDQPLADLPILPAHLWAGLAEGQVAPDGPSIGSGPYRLADYRPGEGYRFEANPDYFLGRPAVDIIEVPIVGEAAATIEALRKGEVDMVPVSLPADAVPSATGVGTRILQGPSYLGTVLMFNMRRDPFDRPEARRAVARALDLDRIAREVGGAAAANRGVIHPESPWASTESLHVTDAGASRRELAALGLPPVEVLAPENDPVRMEAARQVVQALQGVGLGATVKPLARDALSVAVGADGGAPGAPAFDLAIWGTPPLASYDPDFVTRLFGSNPKNAPLNVSGYESPAFDDLAGAVATTTDAGKRRAVVGEELKLLAADLPVVPLFFSTGTFAFRPNVYGGWQFVKGTGIFDKQSFVGPSATRRAGGTNGVVTAESSGGLPLGLLSLILLGVAIGLVATIVVRRR